MHGEFKLVSNTLDFA